MQTEKKQSPVAAAMARFLEALQEGEGMALKKKPAMEVKIETGGEEKCPECDAGTCAEHMAEEDAAGLAQAYGA